MQRIASRKATVGIIGLFYVGFPLARAVVGVGPGGGYASIRQGRGADDGSSYIRHTGAAIANARQRV